MEGPSLGEGAERRSGFSLFRLKKHSQFRKVYNKGRSFKKEDISLSLLENGLDHNRIGISVRTKKPLCSVKRNRCRRLLRESFRLTGQLLKPGYDIIITSNKDISSTKCDNVRSEIMDLYKRSGLLR